MRAGGRDDGVSNPTDFSGTSTDGDSELPVTRAELYLARAKLQKPVLAVRLEAAAMRIGGGSIVEAHDEFNRAEGRLDAKLNALVHRELLG